MTIDEAIAVLRDRAQCERDLARIYRHDSGFASFVADRAEQLANAVDVVVAALEQGKQP